MDWFNAVPVVVGLSLFEGVSRVWFSAVVSVLLSLAVWFTLGKDPMIAFGAVVGSTAFFVTHGFKQNAEQAGLQILSGATPMSDVAKILHLEIIDMTAPRPCRAPEGGEKCQGNQWRRTLPWFFASARPS